MVFTRKEERFVLEYAWTLSNKTVQHGIVKEFTKMHQVQGRFEYGTKNWKRRVVCVGQKELDDRF